MDEAELKQRTRDTARKLFHSLPSGVGYEQWKRFDKGLARDLSMFFTGTLYSREVISQAQRELCAVASLTVLNRSNELRAHIHAALNVGATRQEVASPVGRRNVRNASGRAASSDALPSITPPITKTTRISWSWRASGFAPERSCRSTRSSARPGRRRARPSAC